MSVDSVRKKLQEAKSEEERRLVVEEVRDYRTFLREKLGRREIVLFWHSRCTYSHSAATGTAVHVPCIYATAVICMYYIRNVCKTLERQIYELYETTLDPPMPSNREHVDKTYDVAFWTAVALTVLSVIIALVKLGILPL